MCISDRTCLSLYSSRVVNVVDTLTQSQIKNQKSIIAIYILVRDLTLGFLRSAPISVAYMILDVLVVCILPFEFILSILVSS